MNVPTCPPSGFLELASKAVGIPVAVKDFSVGQISASTTVGECHVRARCFDAKTGDKRTIYIEAMPVKLKSPVWSNVNPNVVLGCSLP